MIRKILTIICTLAISAITGFYIGGKVNDFKTMNNSIKDKAEFESVKENVSFENMLSLSDVIITGTVIDINKFEKYDEYSVKIEKIYKGQYEDCIIPVRNYHESYSTNDMERFGSTHLHYDVDSRYLFILQHISNIFDDRYLIMGDTYIPLDNKGEALFLSTQLKEEQFCEEAIKKSVLENPVGSGEKLSVPYFKDTDVFEIAEKSDVIIKAKIREVISKSDTAEIYACTIVECYKGNLNTENDIIYVAFFPDTVETDVEYNLILNKASKDSYVYSLSSYYSIVSDEDFNKLLKK